MAQADYLLYECVGDSVKAKITLVCPPHSPPYIHHIRAYPSATSATALKQILVMLSRHASPYVVPCQLLEERKWAGWFEVEFREEYMQSLSDYKRKQSVNVMSEEEVLSSLRGILQALSWAQEAGIPHRALTDNAIRVSNDENRLLLSWFQWPVPAEDSNMEAGQLLPPHYRSPALQQLLLQSNPSPYNPYQADLFALGVVVVQLASTESFIQEAQGETLYKWVDSWDQYLSVKQLLLEMLRPANCLTAQQLFQFDAASAYLSQDSHHHYTTTKPRLALSRLTLEFSCISICNDMLEIENSISRRKVELQLVKTSDGKAICATDNVLGRKVKVNMLHGGLVLSAVLQESQMEVASLESPQITTQSSELQVSSDVSQFKVPGNYHVQRHFDCRTCGKIYSIEPYQQVAAELFNFCSDECALGFAEMISTSEATGPGCMYCGKTWDWIKERSLAFMPLHCNPSHFFCSSDHFRLYIDQESYTKSVTPDQVCCPICSQQIHPRDIAKALLSQTQSFRTMQEKQTCFSCHSSAQELQLPCGHCFCRLCLPSYLQQGLSTPCPRCSNL